MRLTSRIYQTSHHALLIDFLSSKFTYLTKDQWRERIRDRFILVNEKPADPQACLKNGDIVTYDVQDFPEPDADLTYGIVYEDDWIVGVNKTGNLLVHKAGASITRNLVYLLRHVSGNPAYARIQSVNRLDRETSGVVLFSKRPDSLRRLHRDFAAGKIEKEYIAVVHGSPKEKTMCIDMPIGSDTGSSIGYKFKVDTINGKSAMTRVETISEVQDYALLRVFPHSGRTHQIRIHLASIGCPVVGDKLYGMSEEKYLAWRSAPHRFAEPLEFPRQALHCKQMTFKHPNTGEKTIINAPVPPDMMELIRNFNLSKSAL